MKIMQNLIPKKLRNSLNYFLITLKITQLFDEIGYSIGDIPNNHQRYRIILWYMASSDIDLALYKVLDWWGIDELTNGEIKKYNFKHKRKIKE